MRKSVSRVRPDPTVFGRTASCMSVILALGVINLTSVDDLEHLQCGCVGGNLTRSQVAARARE